MTRERGCICCQIVGGILSASAIHEDPGTSRVRREWQVERDRDDGGPRR